ncbi:MAG: response regulator [Planctomycetota bacterium]
MAARIHDDNELVFVDDDDVELMLIERYLRSSRVQNPLRTFSSGEALIEYLQAIAGQTDRYPSLVLLDVRMPTMDGFEVVEAVRAMPAFTELPMVVMFSNSDRPADRERADQVGADGYVVKPSDGAEYVRFLDSLVAGK